jgi:GAF domain-containing protein
VRTNVVEAAVPNPDDQPSVPGWTVGGEPSAEGRLRRVLRAFAAAPLGAGTPQLLILQAVAAIGSSGGVVCGVQGNRVVILASEGCTPEQRPVCGPLIMGDLSLPLTYAATTGQPVWLVSQADTVDRFPRIVELVPGNERAYAALPLRANGQSLGVMGISFAERHDFTEADRDFLLALADICALHLQQWSEFGASGGRATSTVQLGHLVQALSRAETADEVARVIAEAGSISASAEFANIAVANRGAGRPATAHLYHASSLAEEVAQRYMVIPLDESTPLGTVLRSGGEVWLRSLSDIGTRYPSLLEDTVAAGLASTASLALYGRGRRVIGAMGVAWAQAQAFTDAQKDEVRVVARLAADALGRAQMLEAERAARERTERLQRTMTALVASASLAEVTAAVFQHGLPPFGASAARLALVDQQQPELLVTLNAVGVPDSVVAGWDELSVSVSSPSRDAAATSDPVYLPTPEDLAAKYPDAYNVLIRSSHQAWIALPLRSSGRTLGTLTLAFPEPHPIDDGPEQIILTALGSAVADALSRAIQHDTDRDLVMSVQRSLLPETLPEHPGVRLGARYMPAETHYGIGGDWYDAVLLPGGRILLLVGDVAGHGLKAAITMGQMRSAARALAPTHGPAALLDALDQFVGSGPDVLPATAAVAVIDPAERTLRYCLAGHPPLLLRDPGGTITTLDEARGPLLGYGATGRPEQVVTFLPGSCLVLFTDGLVERRDEIIDAGFARLGTAFAAAATLDPANLCEVLIERSLPRNGRNDDTAILCAFLT